MNAIKRARQYADSILSKHEIMFAVLVSNDALEPDFERQYGLGLVDAFGVVRWERLRYRRKLKGLWLAAQKRAAIRSAVTAQGFVLIDEMKARVAQDWPEYLDQI